MTTVSVLLFLSLAVDNEAAGLRNACKAAMQKSNPVSAADLAAAEMIAGRIFASGTADAEALRCARRVRPWSRMVLEQHGAAEIELLEALKADPQDAVLSQWLGSALVAQKNPDRAVGAIFHFARAAYYRGPGALDAIPRRDLAHYVVARYTNLHGNDDGLDDLIQLAQASAFPPGGLAIAPCGGSGIQCPPEYLNQSPASSFWRDLQVALEGHYGQDYFKTGLKDASVPGGVQKNGVLLKRFHAVVLSTDASSLSVAVNSNQNADGKLLVDKATAASVEPGSLCSFSGVATDFQQKPFQLVFDLTNQISILRCH